VATALLAPATEAGLLTAAFRAAQARRAAAIAALVAVYYRTRVDVEDPSSIENWLRIMVPRILREHQIGASQAALFANTLRRLEVPDAPVFTFTAAPDANEDQVRTSLMVVGPKANTKQAADIRRLSEKQFTPADKAALIRDLERATEVKISGAVARHAQNGARHTIQEGIREDPVALGYVRVTRDQPCYFCAMLASRGRVYEEGAFDDSDPRFTGPGDAKVHDHCQCHLKPIYSDDDDYLKRSEYFRDLWLEMSTGSSRDAILTFRRAYEAFIRSTAS